MKNVKHKFPLITGILLFSLATQAGTDNEKKSSENSLAKETVTQNVSGYGSCTPYPQCKYDNSDSQSGNQEFNTQSNWLFELFENLVEHQDAIRE
ncbi:hypothetical protein [Aliikangiella coralliicola]|uniref:Uncharacterized protein n=1 Tax=Aliikangiella coralliicola TaxID=2592383 RepID=A0A545UCD8_9GAMM|nr:hypothetical protein [Aliikangiella coralliicola]TQV87126.1 hypothetical protein FLL46_15080 [Aliikangiella coralliicola]